MDDVLAVTGFTCGAAGVILSVLLRRRLAAKKTKLQEIGQSLADVGFPKISDPIKSAPPEALRVSKPHAEHKVQMSVKSSPALRKLEKAYKGDKLIAFVGPGVSLAAGLPTGTSLVDKVHDYARGYGVSRSTLQEVADLRAQGNLNAALGLLEHGLGRSTFVGAIQELLEDKARGIPRLAQALASLAPRLRAVLTTNLDRLLERAFPSEWVPHHRPLPSLARGHDFILKLHGTLHDADTWVLTRDQFDRAMYADPNHQPMFRALMLGAPMLFVGFGLDEPDFCLILGQIRAMAQGQPPQHFALVPKPILPGRRREMAKAGVTLVGYDDLGSDSQAGAIRILESLSRHDEVAVKSEVPLDLSPRAHDTTLVSNTPNPTFPEQKLRFEPLPAKNAGAGNGTGLASVSVSKKIVDYVRKTGSLGSQQVVIRGAPGGSRSAPTHLCLTIGGTIYKLTAADSHSIWRSHQEGRGERDFDLLFRVLSAQPGVEVGVESFEVLRSLDPITPTVPTLKTQPSPARANLASRRLARLLDRSRYWKDLIRPCNDSDNHLGIVVHAASHQNLELFLERIRTYIRGNIRRRHRPWTVVMQSDFQTVVGAADWGARVREVLGDTDLDFTESLEDATEYEAAMFILADPSGRPLRCGDGGLSLQQQEGLLEFLSSYLPKHLAAARTNHPLRFVVPIEYPPYANEPDNPFYRQVSHVLQGASGLDYVPIAPLELPTWSEVWTSIKAEFRRDRREPPAEIGVACQKILRDMTARRCTFAELAEAIGEVVDAAKVAA